MFGSSYIEQKLKHGTGSFKQKTGDPAQDLQAATQARDTLSSSIQRDSQEKFDKGDNADKKSSHDVSSNKSKPAKKQTHQNFDCSKETYLLMFKRWKKIQEDFVIIDDFGEESFDISKLGEICDNIKYDVLHWPQLREDPLRVNLLNLAQVVCMINVPFEYGMTNQQKLKIGMKITHNLIQKIHHDLVWWRECIKKDADQ